MSPPTEADTPVADMDAKLRVAIGSGGVQQLKDLVNKQEQDSEMMVVVMAKKQVAASAEKTHHMDPHLLALASSGSFEELKSLLRGGISSSDQKRQTNLVISEEGEASGKSRGKDDDIEANNSILSGVTAEGNTALHVVAGCGQGDNFFTRSREAKHLLLPAQQNNNKRRCPTDAERHNALTAYGYGDGDNFLVSARIIYEKDKDLLFVATNNNGDTPLHCAARAGKYNMVNCLIDLAFAEGGDGKMKALLRKENKDKESALLEAVRNGNNHIIDLLIDKDSELASVPGDGGASPMYLAIVLRRDEIVKTLYDKSSPGKLSFAGPKRQNALHAAVLRYPDRYSHACISFSSPTYKLDLRKLLKWNKTHLSPQNKDLTTQRDENGSTPLHFAAAINFTLQFRPSNICRQVLEANPDALYQADHAGFFPIHVAASVGASWNVDMFVTKCPGTAGLRDAKGRTFLHVAAKKKEVKVIRYACRNLSLSWIMNMVDNDGNTALHLAIKTGSIQMFCSLLGNPQVNLNLPNNRGETPSNIAQYKWIQKGGLYSIKNSEAHILLTLTNAGADIGVSRGDHLKDVLRVKVDDESKETMEVVKDSTGAMCIGSVLIATVTFGATFAAPGGYIADDHRNGGSPILSPRYAFDAFIASNSLAFVFATTATICLMQSGSPLYNPRSRKQQLTIASYLVSFSITCLTAAFALAAYAVLAPVAQKTAVATCVLASLAVLYKNLVFIVEHLLLLSPLQTRKGFIWTWVYSACIIMCAMLLEYWPLIFIFAWAAHAKPSPEIGAAAQAQAPPPLAST